MQHTQADINKYYEKGKKGKDVTCKVVRPEEHKDVEIITFYENGVVYIYRRENNGQWKELPFVGSD